MQKRWWIVVVTVVVLALAAATVFLLTRGGSPSGQPGPSGTPGPNRARAPAPITGVEILTLESFPPQYAALVEFALSNGCVEPGGYDLARQGNMIQIKVWVLEPTDPNTVCTRIYRTETYNIPLGSEFTSGNTYTVDVNGKVTTFTAQ